jgi:hypothetical protein
MRARVKTIRRRVAVIAVAAFLVAFNVIAWTGSMGTTTTSSAATKTTTTASTDEPAAVTTAQS